MEHSLRLLIGALRIEQETFREYSRLKGPGSMYFRKAAREAAKKIPDYQAAIILLQAKK